MVVAYWELKRKNLSKIKAKDAMKKSKTMILTLPAAEELGSGVLGGAMLGGAHELKGDSSESSVFSSLSLSSKGSQMILGNKPTLPVDLTIPFHHPSSTPLGMRLSTLILSPALKDISSLPVAS